MTTAREETTRLADLLRREHLALAEFLVALAAFDASRGWMALGYRSLFDFLLRELALPKGPAYYRMTAAGLIQKYPEVVAPLRDGRLHLTSVTLLAKVITPENRAEVLPRFFHLSKTEAKDVVAEIAPAAAPPVRTVVTADRSSARAPAQARAPATPAAVTPVPGSELATADLVLPEEPRSCQLAVPGGARSSAPAAPAPQRTTVDPLTAERSRLHVTVSRRLLGKLAAARDALSLSHPGASEETILELGLDLILDRYRKRRGLGAKPRKPACASAPTVPPATAGSPTAPAAPSSTATSPSAPPPAASLPPPSARSRDVPAAVWRAVWERDHGCCAWPLEGGGVCASTRQLELDHVDGWALGAGTTVEECRLLCRWHQDVSARRLYGDEHMNTFTRPKGGGGCSERVAEYGSLLHRHARARPAARWRAPTAASGASPFVRG